MFSVYVVRDIVGNLLVRAGAIVMTNRGRTHLVSQIKRSQRNP